jgi:putative radical SAM enzyme (TIGR03279 family)
LTSGRNSAVECKLPKLDVEGSTPFARFNFDMKVTTVNPSSPLFGLIKPGNRLIAINGRPVRDSLDYYYNKLSRDTIKLVFKDAEGTERRFRVDCREDLGIYFEDERIIRCNNKCVFCFVHQQPSGMRPALYIKDDDYRLSFINGNFISLSSLRDDDLRRIIRQRLSPLYVSVHTTDESLRRRLFGNRRLPAIMPRLRYLCSHGIKLHTQVVVCPGWNDGAHLEKTIDDLAHLYPGVKTLGIVPVGLTRYRNRLPVLTPVNRKLSERILNDIHSRQREFLGGYGTRFVFAADEFYISARKDFPGISHYEGLDQLENGIGMARLMLTDFNRRKRYLKSLKGVGTRSIALLTGTAAAGIMAFHIIPELAKMRINVDIYAVENRFWGKLVTVSGLLTGRDLLNAARRLRKKYDSVLIPPNCLNRDGLFLDGLSLSQFNKDVALNVIAGSYSLVDTLRKALI